MDRSRRWNLAKTQFQCLKIQITLEKRRRNPSPDKKNTLLTSQMAGTEEVFLYLHMFLMLPLDNGRGSNC